MTPIIDGPHPLYVTIERAAPMAKPEEALVPDAEENPDSEFFPFGEDGFTFLDLIDMVNPLQHIPGIATLYRNWSGDTIDPVSRIAGSTIYFGPIGAAVAAANIAIKESTGRDVGEHLVAWLNEDTTGNSKIAAIENDAKTRTITGTAVSAAGTDSENSVTTWARTELAYRAQLAEQQRLTPPHRASANSMDTSAWQVTADTEQEPFSLPGTSRSAHQLLAAYGVAPTSLPTTAATWQPDSSEGRPLAKHGTDAYRQVAGTWNNPDLTKPAPQAASNTIAKPAGAIAQDGGWFSLTRLNALAHYNDKARAPGLPPKSHISLVN